MKDRKELLVSVVGLGYIGLPTAATISSYGINVLGIDKNKEIVDTINEGKIHIVEPDLDSLVEESVKNGKLKAYTEFKESDVFIIAVPTPIDKKYNPDISLVDSAIVSISEKLKKGDLIIVESTIPVGTTERLSLLLRELRPDLIFPEKEDKKVKADVSIAHCPERVLPGNIVKELIGNDRTIGGITHECAKKAENFYQYFVEGKTFVTDARTAELAKLVENSYRDVNIAFANELSIIADKLEINIWELIELANHHPRVNILQPGPGVGGHCIAVDPWFIVSSAPEESRIIELSRRVNDSKPNFVIDKIKQAKDKIGKDFEEITIATLGLSFKANIDDLRESPALQIAESINTLSFSKHLIVEPNILKLPKSLESKNTMLVSLKTAIAECDLLILLVDHSEFSSIDRNSLDNKLVIDTRGVLKNN